MLRDVLKTLSIIVLMMILLTSSVFAVTGTVTGSTVRIREGASSNSPEVSAAKKGEKVEIIGEEGNWYHVKFETKTGYISKDYVDTDYTSDNAAVVTEQPEPTSEITEESDTVVADESGNGDENIKSEEPEIVVDEKNYEENQVITFYNDSQLRYLPNYYSRIRATISAGSSYTVVDSLNNWVKVSNEENTGWVLKTTLDGENITPVVNNEEQTPSEVADSNNIDTNVQKGKVNVDSARIRKSPNGDPLDSLSNGTEVTILGEEDGWYKIKTDKYESCYIAKRLITEM